MKNLRKQTTIVSFLFLTFCVSAQNISITNSLNRWNIGLNCVSYEPIDPYDRWSTYFVHIEGDTVMNNKHYKKLFHCADSTCINKIFKSYIREDSGKVFLANKTRELILYDFNLNQGDSLVMYFLWDDMDSNPLFIQVDSVKTTIFQDQKERLMQFVSVYDYRNRDHSINDVLVEGIGSLQFGLEYPVNLFITGANGCYANLLCFYTDKNLVYSNPEFNDCYISSEASANNPSHYYQPLYSNRIALFENSEKQIKALRIDSVKTDTDSVFYPFATIQEVFENCFSPYKASWLGEKVVVKPDGTNLFFNRDGDTITLKTRARLNESWIAFQRGDDFRVKAKVQSVGLETFLGLTDSVKTITLTVIDKNENTLENPLNNLQLKISKTFGFIKTLNFYLFPDITVRYPADRLETFSLVGLTNPNAGVQNLTWFEVNDFQPGDELHILEHKTGDAYLYLPYREYDNRCIYICLERTDFADSIVYHYARKQSIEVVYTDSTSLELFNDTIISVVKANPDFDKLPGEPVIKTDFAYQMHMSVNQFTVKIDPDATERFLGTGDCLNTIVGEGCFYEKKYWDGLGGPYYYCSGYVGDTEERKLVYYKKGETEWGEKLVIKGIPEPNDNKPEFAPIGAEWYYNYDPDVTLDDGYQKISVLRDTIIDNHNCRLLQIRNIGYSYFYQKTYNYKAGNIILYESGDTVRYYKNGQFYILYDFSAEAGNTFYSISYLPNCTQAFKVRVDSITNIEINDQLLKKFHVTLNDSLQANYIEKIGYNNYLLPQFGLGCEILTGPHYPGPLRCYYDNEIGVYSTNIVSACDYITSSDEIEMLNEGIRVFPNPANDFVTILNPSNNPIKTIELTDFTGRIIQTWRAQEPVENTLNIQHIPPGIYLLKAETEKGIKTGKLVVN